MKRDTFIQLYNKNQGLIFDSLRKASYIHDCENHKYGMFDYSTHLVEVLSKVYEYGHDICENEKDIIILNYILLYKVLCLNNSFIITKKN